MIVKCSVKLSPPLKKEWKNKNGSRKYSTSKSRFTRQMYGNKKRRCIEVFKISSMIPFSLAMRSVHCDSFAEEKSFTKQPLCAKASAVLHILWVLARDKDSFARVIYKIRMYSASFTITPPQPPGLR